jgi:hypothetical protein
VTTTNAPRLMAGSEWRPVGYAAREAGLLREYLFRALQRGQIPSEKIEGRICVRLDHARIVKKWRAKEFDTWDSYQAAVKATGEAVS